MGTREVEAERGVGHGKGGDGGDRHGAAAIGGRKWSTGGVCVVVVMLWWCFRERRGTGKLEFERRPRRLCRL